MKTWKGCQAGERSGAWAGGGTIWWAETAIGHGEEGDHAGWCMVKQRTCSMARVRRADECVEGWRWMKEKDR